MASQLTLPHRLSIAFGAQTLPDGVRLLVVRRDGLMVWDGTPDSQSQSLAALCGGVWEASLAMAQAAGSKFATDGFRLSFDDSSDGVYVLPLILEGTTYYLAGVYRDCVNPARLRKQVQDLRDGIRNNWKAQVTMAKPTRQVREGYLFSDITDEEMNRLFGLGV